MIEGIWKKAELVYQYLCIYLLLGRQHQLVLPRGLSLSQTITIYMHTINKL